MDLAPMLPDNMRSNNIGLLAYPETQLYAVKALDENSSGYVSDIISGIE